MTNTAATARQGAELDRDFSTSIFLGFGGLMRAVTKVWFRYEITGLETIPDRPCMMVGNHSGVGVADVLCLLGGWVGHFADRRRVVGMMHDLFVGSPLVGDLCRGFGAVRADPAAARAAIARGNDLAVFPGGDIDACRPLTRSREVDFGPRRGYVRIALETATPVVPMVTLGSHGTYLLLPLDPLWRAIRLRRWSRLSRFPISLAGVALAATAVAAALGAAPAWWVALLVAAALIPNPVRVTSRVLPAMDLAAMTVHVADPDERVELAHRLVHGALADALRTMRHG